MFSLFKKEGVIKSEEPTSQIEKVYDITFVLDSRTMTNRIKVQGDISEYIQIYFNSGVIQVGNNHFINTNLINEITFKEV